MKRTLCLFLALILAVGICFSAPVTITASAAFTLGSGAEHTVGAIYIDSITKLKFKITDTENKYVEVCGCYDSPESIIIPETVEILVDYDTSISYAVTAIGEDAFFSCDSCISIKSLTIPNSVTTIAADSLAGIPPMATIYVPCKWHVNPLYNTSSLFAVKVIKDDHEYNENGVCKNCDYECSRHTYQFATCKTCAYICQHETIIDGVCEDCGGKFCGKTETDKVVWFYDEETTTLTISGEGEMPYFGEYNQPWHNNKSEITKVVINKGVTSIGEFLFFECTNLASVTIPESVETIGAYAFLGCRKLKEIVIPGSVTQIGTNAFGSCYELTTVNVPCSWNEKSIYSFAGSQLKIAEHKPIKTATCISKAECSVCGEYGDFAPHTYENGKCTVANCDNACAHETITDGVCVACGVKHCGKTENDKVVWFYDEDTTTLTITGSGAMADYTGYDMPWYNYRNNITRVVIEKGVTTIGKSAFKNCTSLTTVNVPCSWNENPLYIFEDWVKVDIPKHIIENNNCTVCKGSKCGKTESDTVTWVYNEGTLYINGTGAMADYYTGYDMPWCNYKNNITKVVIENGVTTIGNIAFYNCKALTTVEILDRVTTIGDGAFYYCTSLTTIKIPDSVTTIGKHAFDSCEKLTLITIPESVTTIGDWAFSSCTELTEIEVAEGNTNYLSVDGGLFNAEKTELLCYPAGQNAKSYTIPDSVKTIGEGAFKGCTELTSVTIPESVTTIGIEAFYGCTALETVTIPESVTTIGIEAFYGCTALETVTILSSEIVIEANAFDDCEDVNLIVEPGSKAHNYAKTNSIPYTFNGYTEAETAQIEKLTFTPIYKEADNENSEITGYSVTARDTSISGALTIPATYNGKPVTSIGIHAFSSCTSLETVTIGNSVTSIGDYAFSACTALATVTIPDSVTTIGNYTFNDCRALATVTIPDSVTTIGNYTFNACTALTSVTIPGSETTIGNNAFNGCTKILLFVNKNNTDVQDYATDNNINYVVDGSGELEKLTFTLNEDGESYSVTGCDTSILGALTIPSTYNGKLITAIGVEAFYNCDALTSVTIPESVTTIGDYAFFDCESLTKIDLSNVEIGSNAFEGCKSVTEVNLDKCTIGSNVFVGLSSLEIVTCKDTDIPYGAFYGDKLLKTVTISGGEIGEIAFCGCDVLSSLNISGVETIGRQAFKGCTTLTKIDLSNVEIGSNAFEGCKSVTEVNLDKCTIGSNVFVGLSSLEIVTCKDTDIPDEAFYGNKSLKTVTISGGEIGEMAFGDCDALKEISIATDIIGKSAFCYCEYLETIEVEAKKISESAFAQCTSLKNVKLGDNVEIIGTAAFEACRELTEVVIPASVTSIDAQAFYSCSNLKCIFFKGTEAAQKTIGDALVTNAQIHYGSSTHTFNENYTVDVEPTCTEKGSESQHCKYCDLTQNSRDVKELGHDIVIDKAVEATCTKTGLTEGSHCSRCNGATVKQEIVAAKGHTTSVINAKAATCTVDGYSGDTYCSTCKSTVIKGSVIKATGHKLTLVGATHATFKADGYTGDEVCSVCNQTLKNGAVIKKLTLTTPAVTIKNTATGIEVKWNAIENAESYIVYRRVYNASTKKWSGWSKLKTGYTSTKYVDTTVTLGTQYRYTVRAVNGDVMSKYESTATMKYNVTPTVKVSNTANGVKVTWSTAANATGYRVYRSTLSNGKWSGWKNMGTAKANKTAWTDKNVKTGVTYKYTVRAVYNKVISSYNKNGVSVLFLTTPTVKIANASNGIKVSWNKISGATSYYVYSSQFNPSTNKWSNWTNHGTVNTTSWTDTTAQSGVTYKYTIRAVNGKTLSSYKATAGLIYLAQPTVKIANASTGVKVTWSQSAGATGYTVYRAEAVNGKWSSWKNMGTAKAEKSSWVDKSAKSGTKYKYTVRAVNGSVKSTYKATGGLLYLAQPTVTVKAVSNGINVAWTQSAGAKGYTVYRAELVNGKWTNWKNMGTAKAEKSSWVDKSATIGVTYKYTVRAVNGKVRSTYTASNEVTK